MSAFFDSASKESWTLALKGYPDVLAAQVKERLPELDEEVWKKLPQRMEKRQPPHLTRDELVSVMEWKMKRGEWRGWNVKKALRNAVDDVARVSGEALALCPHPRAPLERLCTLHGVGPATASAVLAAVRPDVYAFLDEDACKAMPGLGEVKFTVGYAVKFMDGMRKKAADLGWKPQEVAQALWVVGRLGL